MFCSFVLSEQYGYFFFLVGYIPGLVCGMLAIKILNSLTQFAMLASSLA
jgi:hypothetical protein